MGKKVILTILDGWGISPSKEISAVDKAKTPFMESLYKKYPHATLRTDGLNVGLPEGQMGNSEVGHMNLGAGRIVYQDLVKINRAVEKNTLKDEPVLEQAFNYAKNNDKAVHFLGLVSDGGVHSHIKHLKGLVTAAQDYGISKKYVHAFTDGRDVDPHSGKGFIEELMPHFEKTDTQLASIIGRYYAMDRDKRWERVEKAYDLIVKGEAETYTENPLETLQKSYDDGISDEFIKPIAVTANEEPVAKIAEGDVVIFFNFRTDRGRQLTQALSQEDFPENDMKSIPLYYVTMTKYDDTFKNINVVYKKENIKATLGEVLEYTGKSQIRAAETEKYPHVTFFFSGGREEPFRDEKRIMVNSPKVATYDLQPEMSAYELKDKLVKEISEQNGDFICLNFANPDMVGHTGDFDAAVKACETVDECLKEVVTEAEKQDYSVIVIADHGNSETMVNEDGSPNTAHTTNPVPFILVDKDIKSIKDGILGDIAPTILDLMDIKKPDLMTQNSLLS
ncbi:2,3-bisphosphoglycerate-independent phosphoglycerate mutase [Psychroflexus sp. CAK57W]|uniref:2,3-bisphosphoglycerate-independent phosphoglycerate mutase n=1 Tax=Psychroflexus curvus TaxID=2873595 RepID=UPI001CCAC097|nr:2,3-bisphosphoglycerate-independent phosphoglycerate mutase [Psychroflexus curvus]MBZ9627473.1 2,3-bisphosphoglycerate-independent phosphoglycerate mutase [Psychroflexus curvus]MBZ9785959.1 2,3-bisphosphoglycerate-independent phosphoglycerate mutase [Psychroflexus curvus]